jgi:hypothetical protein
MEEMETSGLGLSSPWEIHLKKVRELLRGDGAVTSVTYDEDGHEIRVFVNGNDKAEALQHVFDDHLDFGNVKVDVTFIPSNDEPDEAEYFRRAFEGNQLFCGILRATTPQGYEQDFAVFEPAVVQYFSDDLGSAFGLATTTVEQLAKDLLVCGDVRICSEPL